MTGENGSFFRIVVILSKANATLRAAQLMYAKEISLLHQAQSIYSSCL